MRTEFMLALPFFALFPAVLISNFGFYAGGRAAAVKAGAVMALVYAAAGFFVGRHMIHGAHTRATPWSLAFACGFAAFLAAVIISNRPADQKYSVGSFIVWWLLPDFVGAIVITFGVMSLCC